MLPLPVASQSPKIAKGKARHAHHCKRIAVRTVGGRYIASVKLKLARFQEECKLHFIKSPTAVCNDCCARWILRRWTRRDSKTKKTRIRALRVRTRLGPGNSLNARG